jgi:hypothetical protein
VKEIVWIAFAFVAVFLSGSIRAETVTYTWTAVDKRVNGTPVEHPISYVIRHNNTEHKTNDITITLRDYPIADSESCVRAVESHPGGLAIKSAWSCVTIKARPEPPSFRMIQLLE